MCRADLKFRWSRKSLRSCNLYINWNEKVWIYLIRRLNGTTDCFLSLLVQTERKHTENDTKDQFFVMLRNGTELIQLPTSHWFQRISMPRSALQRCRAKWEIALNILDIQYAWFGIFNTDEHNILSG